jgi:hypothetical protein
MVSESVKIDSTQNDNYKEREISGNEFIKRKIGTLSRLYLTSGGKEYVPDGLPGHHSPFASRFINALDYKGGNDGILTFGEIKSFVEKLNPYPRGGVFNSKSDGDFVLVFNGGKK